ncbi:RcpC/CpaB family pilus assembly protein [Micromonosporaceae bacterium Da 78-11]
MRRRVLILAAALMLAVFSGVAVVAYANSADRRALNGRQGKWVLLATETIPADTTGSQIRTRRLIRQVLMPAETVPSGALSKIDSTVDELRLNADLQPDQMLLRGQFEDGAATASPAPTFQIPKNRLAVSIELGIATQVAGNVEPGQKVAVFCTTPRAPEKGDVVSTFVVLPKATVITVGESPEPIPSTSTPTEGPSSTLAPTVIPSNEATTQELARYVVTLAVTQREAELLVNGSHTCFLHLGLLGPSASVSAPASVLASILATSEAAS